MSIATLMLLQAATVSVPPDEASCAPHDGEIVVCHQAIAPDRYRLPLRGDQAPAAPAGPPRAEWGLGGGVRMGVHADSVAMPQGAVSNRAMVTLKLPF